MTLILQVQLVYELVTLIHRAQRGVWLILDPLILEKVWDRFISQFVVIVKISFLTRHGTLKTYASI